MFRNSIPTILEVLIQPLENFLDSNFSDRTITLPVKIQTRNNNTVITWNVFPEKSPHLDKFYTNIQKIIENHLKTIKKGEIIRYQLAKGEIEDSGAREFQIEKGRLWDIYLYDIECFIYIRLINESRLDNPAKKWISVDIDTIYKSAWFL